MPTYKNSNSTVVEIEGVRIEPNQTVETTRFLETLPAGVTKTADTPHIDPIIYSKVISVTETVNLTSALVGISGNYEINFVCAAGDASIELVGTSATAKIIVLGEKWTIRCLDRSVIGFIITISSGIVGATVSKI